jgi:hypothetical protein
MHQNDNVPWSSHTQYTRKVERLDTFTYWKIYTKLSDQISQWLVSDEYNLYFTLKAKIVL